MIDQEIDQNENKHVCVQYDKDYKILSLIYEDQELPQGWWEGMHRDGFGGYAFVPEKLLTKKRWF